MTAAVRLDKWLWAARFFKTRSLATAAVAGGKVHVNGERAKPAKPVAPGDTLRIRMPPYEWTVVVRGLAERRGPAQIAAGLYEETGASRAARERLALGLRLVRGDVYEGKGRPTKKQRRQIDRLDRQ
ncbi:MAG TPA: S4 domain-containing protein [Gemmatimonadales bacterium]|nr:S4 domain-containing protein [Gemmatimonadales bacterium]